MAFFSEVEYKYLQRVFMWMIIIFDVVRYENYEWLCLYLSLIMCMFSFQVFPNMHMYFNYLKKLLFIIQFQMV